MAIYDLVCKYARIALERFGAGKSLYGTALLALVEQHWNEIKDPADEIEVSELAKSWGSFLTRASKDPNSRIKRVGTGYGFQLAESPETSTPISVGDEEPRTRLEREDRLYDLLVQWLTSRKFRAQNNARGRRNGPWGNPDIVGLRIESHFNITHVELATIEAKITLRNWQTDIFQAVSHKRFADRVYFAFAHGAPEAIIEEIDGYPELREYGEKFGIGIIVLFMDEEKYRVLRDDARALGSLDLSDTRVEEIWPAVGDPVSHFAKTDFLVNTLGLATTDDLHRYGMVAD